MAYPNSRYYDPRESRGRRDPMYVGQSQGYSPLMMALMQIMQNKETEAQPILEPEGEDFYANDHLTPYIEGLTPLGRFTDMGMRDMASARNSSLRGGEAVEATKLRSIMDSIRRSVNPAGQTVSQLPSGATITSNMPLPNEAGPIQPSASFVPTQATISSPYGTGGIDTQKTPLSIEGMAGDEWFQRRANAQGANAFAQPEPGYQGKPLVPGSSDWSSWEKATAAIRKGARNK